MTWVILPTLPVGHPHRPIYASFADGAFVGWGSAKAARQHIEDLRAAGYDVEGWEVVLTPNAPPITRT